jgi:hypothetical protein
VCPVYADRPTLCGLFTCALYRRHEAGEIETTDAKALIAKTTELRDRVRSSIEGHLGAMGHEVHGASFGELYELLDEELDAAPDPVAAREENSLMLMYAAALASRLRRDFRNPSNEDA